MVIIAIIQTNNMGRSHESFNKKEQEKKRIKKKQDKEQKREERKSNSGKGKGLESMMAYIDEFGNITDTPPDTTKKAEISLDDIQIGVARRTEEAPEDPMHQGIVTYYNNDKGYGFIRDDKTRQSIFVHVNQLNGPIREQDKVSFEVEDGKKGPVAVRVKVI